MATDIKPFHFINTVIVILMMVALSWGSWWRGHTEAVRDCLVQKVDAQRLDPDPIMKHLDRGHRLPQNIRERLYPREQYPELYPPFDPGVDTN